jgi:hypothetical protein
MVHLYFHYTTFAHTGASAVLPLLRIRRAGADFESTPTFLKISYLPTGCYANFGHFISPYYGSDLTGFSETCQVWIFQFNLHLQNLPRAEFPDES